VWFLAGLLIVSSFNEPAAWALRPPGLEEADPSVKRDLLAGMEEKDPRLMNRRGFLKAGIGQAAGGAALAPSIPSLPALLPKEQLASVTKLLGIYIGWPLHGLLWEGEHTPEALIQIRAQVKEITDSLGPEHSLTRQMAQAETDFRAAIVNPKTAADEQKDQGIGDRSRAVLVALDHPEDLPLWLQTRTLPRLLEQFGAQGLSAEREFERAKASGLTPEGYLESLLNRHVMTSPLIRETRQKWSEIGLPSKLESKLKSNMEYFLTARHKSIVRDGLVGPDPESVFNAREWVITNESEYVRNAWGPIQEAIKARVKARFGGDVRLAEGIFPGRYSRLSIDQAAAQFETNSVAASLQMRQIRLKGALGKTFRELRGQGTAISDEEWKARMKQLEDLSPDELEALQPEQLIAQMQRAYPVPDAREIASRPQLPKPLGPLEALAEDLSRLARRGPVNLWIRTRSQGELQAVRWETPVLMLEVPALEVPAIEVPVLEPAAEGSVPDASYRSFSLDRNELNRLERDLPGRGYWGGGMRYLLWIPSGTSREALVSFFTRTSWWYHPLESEGQFIRIPWPIVLPDLTEKLSSGLEEERRSTLQTGRSL
jgi:hypothetical protein